MDIRQVDSRTKQEVSENGPFLWVDQEPLRAARARRGEVLAAPEMGGKAPQAVPYGLIHDWIGWVFIPGVTLAQGFAATHDYDRYIEFYRPTVVESALLCRTGEEEVFRIRYLRKVLFVTEVLDSEYRLHDVRLDARRWYSISQSTRLQEIKDQGGRASDEDSRYIWRIYSISKYEERDDGVYVEQENVVLSHAIPVALPWLVEPVIRELSRHLTVTYLQRTRDAVLSIRP